MTRTNIIHDRNCFFFLFQTSGSEPITSSPLPTASESKPQPDSGSKSHVVQSHSDTDSDSVSDESYDVIPVPDCRKFSSTKYEALYTWLYYSAAKQGYCCKLCEVFCPLLDNGTISPYVTGIKLSDHPTRQLQRHQQSNNHQKAVTKQANILAEKGKEPLVLQLLKKKSQIDATEEVSRNREYFSCLVKTIYFLVRQHWSLDSVSDLMNHIENIGNDQIAAYLDKHPNLKYTSSTSVAELLNAISLHLEMKFYEKFQKVQAFALLADESSDQGHREEFAVLVRYIDPETNEVKEQYLGIIHVQRTDANSLMQALETFLIGKNIDMKKALFVGFDGCNVMSGENKGG